MPDAGLTPTDQLPASAVTVETTDDRPVTDLWRAIIHSHNVQDALVDAFRSAARGKTALEYYEWLESHDIPPAIRNCAVNVARGDKRRAVDLAADLAPNLGRGHFSTEDLLATAGIFGQLEEPKTIALRFDREAFADLRRKQRVDVCTLIARLSQGLDVRLICGQIDQVWLAQEHRSDLPGVSEWRNASPREGVLAERVATALHRLDHDSTPADILTTLRETASGTLSYHALYAESHVGDGRVRQCLGTLSELGLIETYNQHNDAQAELLEAGKRVLDTFKNETAVQRRLGECVSDPPQSSPQCRVSPAAQDTPHRRGPYRTEYMSRPDHAAAVASAGGDGVGLAEHPVDTDVEADETRTRYVSYDPDHDEGVVAVRATGPLQYMVSVATALASPEFLDRALPPSRLDDLYASRETLRGRRNIGALSDEALNDPEQIRDRLVEWGEKIEDMTTRLEDEDYEDRDRFRGAILSSSHGLAGSIAHLLDVVGVDLYCELRVPGGLDREKDLCPLAKSVAISAGIQSAYGAYAPYRHLYETDAGAPPMEPLVDAEDPLGSLITGFTVRSPDVHRFGDALEDYLRSPSKERGDAPEIGVEVHIEKVGRSAFSRVTSRVLSRKNLRPTRDLVSLLHALCGSPHDAARALFQLDCEDSARTLRADELRYGLAQLPTDRLCPDLPPSVGKLLSALLNTAGRLSQTALAEAAGVSTESVRRHRDALEGLGLISIEGGRYRLALSFQSADERADPVTPETLGSTFTDAVDALLSSILPPGRYADPDDPVGGTLFWPPDPERLLDHADLAPWVKLARDLSDSDGATDRRTVTMGPATPQVAIQQTADAAA